MLHINRPRPPTLPRCPCERENTIWLFYHAANNLPIYISVRSARPPPPPLLRCLIGRRRPEVQPGRPSADISERAMHRCVWKWTASHRAIPADLKKKKKKTAFSLVKHTAVISGQGCINIMVCGGGGSWEQLISCSEHLSLFIHSADHISAYEKRHYLAAESCWKGKWEFDDNNITYSRRCRGCYIYIHRICKLVEMLLFLINFNEAAAAASHYRVSMFPSSGWIKVSIFAALRILDNVHIIPEYRGASFIDTAAYLKGEFTQKCKFSHCLITHFVVNMLHSVDGGYTVISWRRAEEVTHGSTWERLRWARHRKWCRLGRGVAWEYPGWEGSHASVHCCVSSLSSGHQRATSSVSEHYWVKTASQRSPPKQLK